MKNTINIWINKKRILLTLVAGLLFLTACFGILGGKKEASVTFMAMNTYMTLTAYGVNSGEILEEAQKKVEALDARWSVTDEGSDIYAVNHGGREAIAVSDETRELLEFTLTMSQKTDGALDPTIYPVLTAWGFTTDENRIPSDEELTQLLQKVDYKKISVSGNEVQIPDGMQLDFGAVGKGFTGDMLAELLKENGIRSALLDLGGNVQTIGSKPDGSDWNLGIRDPFGNGTVGVLSVSDLAVVTSGSYERYFVGEDGKTYGHIIDPATGYPADNGLASVTIIAGEGKLCDALSTALFIMGLEDATAYWQQNPDFDMILITDSGDLYLTEGIQGKFTLDQAHHDMQTHVIVKEK